MFNWTSQQRKIVSEFFSNVAVAWFAAGVIAPVIVRPASFIDLMITLGWGLAATIVFLKLSIEYIKEKQ